MNLTYRTSKLEELEIKTNLSISQIAQRIKKSYGYTYKIFNGKVVSEKLAKEIKQKFDMNNRVFMMKKISK